MQKELENYTNVLVLLFANFESDDLSPPHIKSVRKIDSKYQRLLIYLSLVKQLNFTLTIAPIIHWTTNVEFSGKLIIYTMYGEIYLLLTSQTFFCLFQIYNMKTKCKMCNVLR